MLTHDEEHHFDNFGYKTSSGRGECEVELNSSLSRLRLVLPFADVDSKVRLEFGAIELGPTSSLCAGGSAPGVRLEFGGVKLGPTSS